MLDLRWNASSLYIEINQVLYKELLILLNIFIPELVSPRAFRNLKPVAISESYSLETALVYGSRESFSGRF